jgi:hypothetical protein
MEGASNHEWQLSIGNLPGTGADGDPELAWYLAAVVSEVHHFGHVPWVHLEPVPWVQSQE